MRTTRKKHVIVFGIDGLRPDMINAETTPNIHALSKKGVVAANHRTVFPSETRGALTGLVTGSHPETHGILGNQFFARQHIPDQTFTTMAADWFAADRALTGGMVTATGLSQVLASNGRSFAVVTSSGQGTLSALNWRGEAGGQTGFNVRHPQSGFPEAIVSLVKSRHGIPDGGQTSETERKAVEVFTDTIWAEKLPEVAIIWLTEADSASHLFGLGSPEQLAKIKSCDAALGVLLDWHSALPEKDEVNIIVTSDHGHATISNLVQTADVLKAAGFSADTTFAGGAEILVRPGRAVGIWLRKPDLVLCQDLFDFFVAQEWYGGGFSPAAMPNSTEGIVPGTLALELTRSRHQRAPDLCINLAGDDEINIHGVPGTAYYDAGDYNMDVGGGTHGGLHRTELTALLLAYGTHFLSGEKSNVPSSITDIAPTVLDLIGIAASPTASGRVLTELTHDRTGASVKRIEVTSSPRLGKRTLLRLSEVNGSLTPEECLIETPSDIPSSLSISDDTREIASAG